jgi:hypothetical protein
MSFGCKFLRLVKRPDPNGDMTRSSILKGDRTATVLTKASISQRALPPFQLTFDESKILMPEHDARPE